MKADWAARWATLGLVAIAACSSAARKASSNATSSGELDSSACMGDCDAGDDGLASSAPDETNPDGIPYPAPPNGYGRNARSGPSPGSVIENFKFLGYPNADTSMGLQRIALADYYDPCGKSYKLIHLTVAAVWCTPCNEETDAMVAGAQTLASDGVVLLQALDDGVVQGTGATPDDLQKWIKSHKTTFTEMLDPDPNPMLGGFFNAAAVPWNADIDPRTMEILDSTTGWAGDVGTELRPGLAAVATPPNYPLPAACN